MRKKPSQRLLERLRKECLPEIPDDTEIVRSYCGPIAKAEWCFSWSLHSDKGLWVKEYGSIFTVTELLKCKTPLVVEPDGVGFHIGPSVNEL